MMKKYLLSLFLALFVAVPVITFAEVSDIDPNPISSQCVNLVNNLRYKDRDVNKNGEVSTLQDFLQTKGYLDNEPTGYFGILTVKAVKDFQKSNGINPTGYVGPITREKIKTLTCDGVVPQPNEQKFTGYLSPQGPTITMWGTHTLTTSVGESNCVGVISTSTQSSCMRVYPVQAKTDSVLADLKKYENKKVTIFGKLVLVELEGGFNGIIASKVTPSSEVHSDNLVISVVSAPNSLNVNQKGVWKVKVSNSNNENLYYSVDWGDVAFVYPLPTISTSTSSSNTKKLESEKSKTFTHSYSKSGSYTIKFTVTSDNGIRCITTPCPTGSSASVTTTINVGDITSIPSITVLSPNGGEVYRVGQQIPVKWKTTSIPADAKITPVFIYVDDNDEEGSEIHNGGAQSLDHVLNTGSTLITPPAGFLNTLGKHFKIKLAYNSSYVTDRNGINVSDSSDDTFTITNIGTSSDFPAGCTSNSGFSETTGLACSSGKNLISFWYGKVNQHTNPSTVDNGAWMTDPDGVSGADLDMLTYCKKWFPNTTSVKPFMNQTIINWKDRGNLSNYTSTKMAYSCVSDINTSSVTVLNPNGGEFYVKGETKTINWKDVVLDTSDSIKYYDISVVSNSSVPCVGEVCALVLPPPPVTILIAKKVAGYSFPWIVGNGVFSTASGQSSIVNGSYLLKICRIDSNICDNSDTYFNVVSPLI